MMNDMQISIRGHSLEETIVEYAHVHDCLPELCNYVDYDPDVGRVPEHWEPKAWELGLVREILILRS